MKKLLILMFILSFIFLGMFALFGGQFENFFVFDQFGSSDNKHYASLLAVLALIGDIILPLPATGIMASLGKLQGFWIGSIYSFVGTCFSFWYTVEI